MRWYCVLCFFASALKNSTLSLLSAMVTFTVSPEKASSSGDGRKSSTTSTGPTGSSVYLVFALINLFSLPPVTRSKYSDGSRSVSKPYGQDSTSIHTETIKPLLSFAMGKIFCDHPVWIRKCILGFSKANPVLYLVEPIFHRVPFKAVLSHIESYPKYVLKAIYKYVCRLSN